MPETPPTLESPPAPSPQPEEPAREPVYSGGHRSVIPSSKPMRVRSARFGELDHHDLVHMLESLDTERERARFRESIYISLFVWLAIAWFAIYGPKVLFHQGTLVTPKLEDRHKNELTYLNTPPDVIKHIPTRPTKVISDHSAQQQTAHPVPDQKTLEQLRRAGSPEPPHAAPPAPRPQQQPAPTQPPQPAAPQQQARTQPPPPPTPQPRPSAIPDAPRPSANSGKPVFQTPPANAGQSVADAARNALRGGDGGDFGANVPRSHAGLETGFEVLSDTMGVDFGPYIKRILAVIYRNWIPLIPEETRPPLSKEGMTLIRFRINKDGSIGAMRLDDSSHDEAINRAAWGSIVSTGQFPPLPAEFQGQNLDLRLQFNIVQRQARSGDR